MYIVHDVHSTWCTMYTFLRNFFSVVLNYWVQISRDFFYRFFFSSDLFSSGLLFLGSYFLRLYWQPPYYFRKKVSGIQNTGLYFQWHFFQELDKFLTFFQSFYFQFFFPETFFPGIFLHRFTKFIPRDWLNSTLIYILFSLFIMDSIKSMYCMLC